MSEILDPRMGSQIVADELRKLRERIAANMYAEGAVASGKTIRSMKVVTEDYGAKLISAQRMPFGVLETGRKGGAIPMSFQSIIYDWMQAKGIHGNPIPYKTNRPHRYSEQERADRSMAAAIAKTIQRSGTRLYRNGGRDTIYSNTIPEAVREIKEKLRPFVAMSVMESIKLNIRETKKQ